MAKERGDDKAQLARKWDLMQNYVRNGTLKGERELRGAHEERDFRVRRRELDPFVEKIDELLVLPESREKSIEGLERDGGNRVDLEDPSVVGGRSFRVTHDVLGE